MADLALGDAELRRAADPAFWRALCPDAALSDDPFHGAPVEVPPPTLERAHDQLTTEGYLHTGPLLPDAECRALAALALRLHDRGLPPPFALAFDDPWRALWRLSGLLNPLLGGAYRVLPDFWLWIVGPQHEPGGWQPHRDMEKPDPLRDGLPELLTVWVPFTDATPLNGCIYALPLHLDPNFPDNLRERTVPVGCERYVRALPAARGSVLAWNQYLLHWGARSSRFADEPRISLAFYLQRADVPPYEDGLITPGEPLPLWRRLGVVAKMVLKYAHRYDYPPEILALCRRCVAMARRR